MYENDKFEITAKTFSFSTKESVKDFVRMAKRPGVHIRAWKMGLSKESECLFFQLTSSRDIRVFEVDSLYFKISSLPKKNLDTFFTSTQKENAVIKLTSKTNEKNEEWLTFEVFS